VKCGSILDPPHESRQEGTETKVKEVNDELGIVGSMLRADALVFEPRWRCEWNEEPGTLEEGPGDDIEEGQSCELHARKARTRLAEDESQAVSEDKEWKSEGSEIVKVEDLRQKQRLDGDLKVVIKWLEDKGKEPTASELRTHSPEVQQLWAQRPCLVIRQGILYRKFIKPSGSLQCWQIIVPRSLRIAFLDAVHAGAWNGHPGIERTRLKLQELAYWRGGPRTRICMSKDVLCVQHTDQAPEESKELCSDLRRATLCRKSTLIWLDRSPLRREGTSICYLPFAVSRNI